MRAVRVVEVPVRDHAEAVGGVPAAAADNAVIRAATSVITTIGPLPDITCHITHSVTISAKAAHNGSAVGMNGIPVVCNAVIYVHSATIAKFSVMVSYRLPFPLSRQTPAVVVGKCR